jgi:hypothetical protein
VTGADKRQERARSIEIGHSIEQKRSPEPASEKSARTGIKYLATPPEVLMRSSEEGIDY